jgi:hypothetical protein
MPASTFRDGTPPALSTPRRQRRWTRRLIAATAVVALPLAAATSALATTAVLDNPAPVGLKTAGPVNSEYGFPAWYEDTKGTRVEPCLDGSNPMCGFVAAPVAGFNDTQPTVFPSNFPLENFYMMAGSQLTLPNGGRATLTLGLEASFINNLVPKDGDQVVFARQRVVVVGGPANTTLTVKHPYGTMTIDTDAAGKGKLVQDVSPSIGNFTAALKGSIGPFLSWDTGAPAGYLGDPAIPHAITGGPNGNSFSVTSPNGLALSTNQFNLQGKLATNTGVRSDAAVLTSDGTNTFIDVFATSEAGGDELSVAASDNTTTPAVPTTPMAASTTATGSKSFYARVQVTGAPPTSITVRNIGDNPVSTSQVPVTKASGIAITAATFDGTTLHIAAISASGSALKVNGTALVNGVADIATHAPPAQVTVTDATGGSASASVLVTGGIPTPPGMPATTPSPSPQPVCIVNDVVVACPDGGVPAGSTPTAKIAGAATTAPAARGLPITLDGSGSTNATAWEWTQVSGTPVTITGGNTAKPTVTPQLAIPSPAPAKTPAAVDNAAAMIQLVAISGTGSTAVRSAPVTVSVPINPDTVAITKATYKKGAEFRVDGTSSIVNVSPVLTPPTTMAVYDAASGVLLGTAAVDTTGAWSLRLRNPVPTSISANPPKNVVAVSSRGGRNTLPVS